MKVTLKNLRTCEASDGVAFSANIYLDGRKAGVVMQAGHGGPNDYSFNKPEDEAAFEGIAAAYGKEHDIEFEAADLLVEDIINAIDDEKFRRSSAKKGFLAFRVRAEPQKLGDDDKDPYYAIDIRLAARDLEVAKKYAEKKYGPTSIVTPILPLEE